MFDKFDIRQKHSIIVVLMLIILTLGVYWPVQDYEFVNFDDNLYVADNYLTQSGLTYQGIIKTFTDVHTGHWHPLTILSHMLDWQLFGDNAGGHHWTSVIIHILNTILLFIFFRYVTGAIWKSAFLAALFAIHPLNVESVAWIAERKNVLSTFFWILTMLFYVWYVKQPNWKRYLSVFFSFALGLMSKPMLVTLPFVLLLLDYWPLNRTTITKVNANQADTSMLPIKREKISFLILEKIPLFVLIGLVIYVTLYAQKIFGAIASRDSFPLSERIGNAIVSYGLYMKKLFWPVDLAVFYPYVDIAIWQVLVAALLITIITILVCRYFRDYPYLPVGWFWYLGTLVPVIGLIQVGSHAMADRCAYVPFIGLFVIIAWGAEHILSKAISLKKLFIFATVFIILLFTVATYNQIKLWRNTVTLFEDALKNNPKNALAHNILGLEAANRGDYNLALSHFSVVMKIKPNLDTTYNNIGNVLLKMGRRQDAIKQYEKALELNNKAADVHYNLGTVFLMENQLDKAVIHLSKAVEIKPDYIEALNGLGVTFMKKRNYNESIINFDKILKLLPANENALKNKKVAVTLQQQNTPEMFTK
jgi:tetratricopeptide (TPR) repeat protein